MRLIDAVNTIREFLETRGEFKRTAEWVSNDGTALCTDWGYFEQGLDELMKYSYNAPTIDAVEVVRCRECKNGKYEFVDNKDWIYCKRHYDYWTADDYCSYGVRK